MAAPLDPAFVEREYNNRALVPEHPAFFARWERDSDFVRSTLPCTLDLPYGPDPRHRIDFFPAADDRATLVFIHGGYWRSLDKSMFSWLAAAYVAAGMNVAMVGYRLCPVVHIDDIVDDVVAAINWMFSGPSPRPSPKGEGADSPSPSGNRTSPSPLGEGRGEGRIILAGHSAGGHLVAALFATALDRFKFDPARIAGGVSLSGLFDFAPLKVHSFNADFKLDEAAVARLNLYDKQTTIKAPLVIAAGGDESSEFQRQSRLIADKWAPQVKALHLLPGYNHFSIVDAFSERGQPLHRETLELVGRA